MAASSSGAPIVDGVPGDEAGVLALAPGGAPMNPGKPNMQRKMKVRIVRTREELEKAAFTAKTFGQRMKTHTEAEKAAAAASAGDADADADAPLRESFDPAPWAVDPVAGVPATLDASESWWPTKRQLDKARDPDEEFDPALEEQRKRALAFVLDRKHANARAVERGEEPPHTIPAELLEFAQPSVARTHNGEGERTVTDKDLIEHNMYGDKVCGRSWTFPTVTGRGGLDFNKFGCQFGCIDCKSKDGEATLATGGYDVQTAQEFYMAHRRQKQAKHQDDPGGGWSDADCHRSAANAVRDLANTMLGNGIGNSPSAGTRRAFALRVTCKNDLCMIAAGVMSHEERFKYVKSEQDANQQNGNKRYGSASLFQDNLILLRMLYDEGTLSAEQVRVLVMDLSLWTFWAEYRQREYIGTAIAVVMRDVDIGFPMPEGCKQEFLNRMAQVPMNYINTVLLEHIIAPGYPRDLNKARYGGPREDGTRSWIADMEAALKHRYPDPNTTLQMYLNYKNWECMGKPKHPETGMPIHQIWDDRANRDIYNGAAALAKRLRPYLDDFHNFKVKLWYAASPAAVEGEKHTTDYRTKALVGAVAQACGLKSAGMRAEFERMLSESTHNTGRKQKCDALVHRVSSEPDIRYAPACNTLFFPCNSEVKHRYVYAARCWGVDGLEHEGFSERCIPALFLVPIRIGPNKQKGWKVAAPGWVADESIPPTRRAALRKHKTRTNPAIYNVPLGNSRAQLQQAHQENVQVRGQITHLGMGCANPTEDQLNVGAKIFVVSAEQQAAAKLHTAAKAICRFLQDLVLVAPLGDGDVARRCGLPTLQTFHRNAEGKSWSEVQERLPETLQLLVRVLCAAHTRWNKLAHTCGAYNEYGTKRASGCSIDNLTIRLEELPPLVDAATVMLKAYDSWRHEVFTHNPGLNRVLDDAAEDRFEGRVEAGPWRTEEARTRAMRAAAEESQRRVQTLLPGLCDSYTDEFVNCLRSFVLGESELRPKLPMCLARSIVQTVPVQVQRMEMNAVDLVGEQRDKAAFDRHLEQYKDLLTQGLLDADKWSLQQYLTQDHMHFFLRNDIRRNHQRISWWVEFLKKPREHWRASVADNCEGEEMSFDAFCEVRRIHAASLFPTIADAREAFARQLLAREEHKLHKERKRCHETATKKKLKEGTAQHDAAFASWHRACRHFDQFFSKRVMRWLDGIKPGCPHVVRIERQFDADLKARFVGGAARELARNKRRAAGAVADSIFDGKNRAAAEVAIEEREMSQRQRQKRREADAEANAARLNDEHEFRDGEGINDDAAAEELPDAAPAGGNADYGPMLKSILRTIGETPAGQDEDEEEAVVGEAALPESERAASSAARRAIQAEDKLTADELADSQSVRQLASVAIQEGLDYNTDYEDDEAVYVNPRVRESDKTTPAAKLYKRRVKRTPAERMAATAQAQAAGVEVPADNAPDDVPSLAEVKAAIRAAEAGPAGEQLDHREPAAGEWRTAMRYGGKKRMEEQLAQQDQHHKKQSRKRRADAQLASLAKEEAAAQKRSNKGKKTRAAAPAPAPAPPLEDDVHDDVGEAALFGPMKLDLQNVSKWVDGEGDDFMDADNDYFPQP